MPSNINDLVTNEPLRQKLTTARMQPITVDHDPWDPYLTFGWANRHLLTSIEVSVTNTCNLRCEHCAVGDLLTGNEKREVELDEIIRRIDEVDTLLTFSLTGGEPVASERLVNTIVIPLLQYAKSRGLKTQINTNLTLPLERYERIAEWIDVIHISYNYDDADEFARIAYAHSTHKPKDTTALLGRLEYNTRALSKAGVFVSAETILTDATLPKIDRIHERIAEIGCLRHEIHPLYPSDFASTMTLPSLEQLYAGVTRLMDNRDDNVWILFGTFPFVACSPDHLHRQLLKRVYDTPNTTVRNDPDGRCRLNVCSVTGAVRIQDFADQGPLGNIKHSGFNELWQKWLKSDTAGRILCHCPSATCLGPNVIVADSYFPGVDWQQREALIPLSG